MTRSVCEAHYALPKDRIEIRDKIVYLTVPNSRFEYSRKKLNPRDNLGPVTVPEDAYFVIGDNRQSFWGICKANSDH